jgi:hypothetical protein
MNSISLPFGGLETPTAFTRINVHSGLEILSDSPGKMKLFRNGLLRGQRECRSAIISQRISAPDSFWLRRNSLEIGLPSTP